MRANRSPDWVLPPGRSDPIRSGIDAPGLLFRRSHESVEIDRLGETDGFLQEALRRDGGIEKPRDRLPDLRGPRPKVLHEAIAALTRALQSFAEELVDARPLFVLGRRHAVSPSSASTANSR